MIAILRTVGLVVVILLALFAGLTWAALESQDVAVLHTRAVGANLRSTRVWFARSQGELGVLWLESATPQRPWYLDIQSNPSIELEVLGKLSRFRAVPKPGASGHRLIRSLLREKYGWADLWVGLIQDTSQSIAVRLLPEDAYE